MHQNIVRFEEFDVSWLQGSQCILASAKSGLRGFRSVSAFFSSLREARESTRAAGWVLDLRACQKVPEELWNWVLNSWFPQIVEEGLQRQALILPEDPSARAQWEALELENLEQELFEKPSLAIHWLGQAPAEVPVPAMRKAVSASRRPASAMIAAVA